jgi:PAS domain S-box-containing protein
MISRESKTITRFTPSELYQQIAELETLIAEHERRETEQQKLLAVEHKRRRLAEALHQAGIALCSSLNYEKVLDLILEQVKEIIPHDAASIMLIEGDTARTSRWRGYAQFGNKGDIVPLSFNIASTPTLCSMQETGQPLVIPYVEQDEKWIQTSKENWIKSYLGAPIRIHDRLIGFLNLNSTIPGFFGQAEVGPLEAFIKQVAIALQNARLYDQGRQEIIERIRALKKERNFISAVLDTADALVMVLNRKGRIVRFNRACEQVTGYSFEEVKRKYWWDLFLPPEEVELFKAEFEKLWLNQLPQQRYESHWVTKDGRQRFIAWSNTVLYDYKGVAEYVLNTGIDLTERKQAEEALRSSEERFREVILSISDHVYVTEFTEDGYQLNRYISPHVEALTGYPQEKFLADWHFWPSQVIHPDDRAAAAAQAARLALGQNSEMEYRLVRANGDIIWVRDSVRVQSHDSSRIVYGVVSDITERKRAEEKLKATNQQLQVLTDRLQEELTLAHKIQQSLLPSGHPTWFGLDLECHTVPAREVGGDFYAYHVFDDEVTRRFAIAVGDVSGKGMPAALLMAASLTALQSVITRVSAPGKLLAELDLAIEPYTRTTLQNCALCYAEIIPLNSTLDDWILRVANAGCITPLICRANNDSVEWVEVGGIPLGVGLGAQSGYAEATFSLKQGDMVIFTSDGVVEATDANDALFGFERLEQAVVRGPKISAAAMLTHLRTEMTSFTASTELNDDLTIVVVQV